jgi:hypothetical protein
MIGAHPIRCKWTSLHERFAAFALGPDMFIMAQMFPTDSVGAGGPLSVLATLRPGCRQRLRAAAGRAVRQRLDLIDQDNIRCRWQNDTDTGACRFDCFDPVIDPSPLSASTARDPRLLALVSVLYGEPACLFKDKLIFKSPGTSGYRLHQDYISDDEEGYSRTVVTVCFGLSFG